MADDVVRIALSRDEALVLHEFLARAVDEENGAGLADALEDDTELWSLNAVLVLLEQVLDEPTRPDFDKQLKAARKRVATANGAWPWEAAEG
jgi:hypothetical protein